MEQEINRSFIILVHNRSWKDVTVSVSARPLVKPLEGNMLFFWFQWLRSTFSTTEICQGQKKSVSEVTSRNYFIYQLGSLKWKLYNIRVTRKSDGWIAECSTPLSCTWIVEDKGIFQEDDTENRCEFKQPS
uniref:Uncharacterized protein n=1 Tax=Sphaerodactylus townsendi TaxID=933632 RepID=A0ACB8ERL9_9SAUR